MQATPSFSRIIQASLLITGTCVGGGMLALPLWVAQNGFLGATLALAICWVFMGLTALCLLEANSWFSVGTHFVNTAEGILGRTGKWITWIVYAFIAYASLVAYIAGGAQILRDLFSSSGATWGQQPWGELLFTLGCGLILAFGAAVLARCNSLFFGLMMLMFFAILLLGVDSFQPRDFSSMELRGLWHAFPLFLTSFSFQMIIPSLRSFLHGHVQAVKRSVGLGLGLTLAIYLAWLAFVYAIVPESGPNSLQEALARGEPISSALIHVIKHPLLMILVMLFSLFAVVTSFLGISLGLYEFLEDSLSLRHKRWHSCLLLLLVLLPSFICAVGFERVFLVALDLSGGLGDTILNGLVPVAMLVIGSRLWGAGAAKLVPFRSLSLIACALFASTILLLELMRLWQGGM